MEYKVVWEFSEEKFEAGVNALLDAGWLPCGGVSVSGWCETSQDRHDEPVSYSSEVCFAQAMTRAEKAEV